MNNKDNDNNHDKSNNNDDNDDNNYNLYYDSSCASFVRSFARDARKHTHARA